MTGDETDAELHRRFVAGDQHAGGAIVRRYRKSIHSFYMRRLPREADDLTQKVFMTYIEKPDRIDPEKVRAFLYGVARFKLLHALRRIKRHPEDAFAQMSLIEAVGDGVMTIVGGHIESEALLKILQSLRLDYMNLLELHVFCRLTLREVAEVLSIPEGTAKRWKQRAIAELREKLIEHKVSLRTTVLALEELGMMRRAGVREAFGVDDDAIDTAQGVARKKPKPKE